MATQTTFRIMKELKEFQERPDTNLFVHYDEADVMKMNGLLIGPEDTPYEYGIFDFLMTFPKEYPSKAPQVISLTTNGGQTRFNPNIYSSGKVCLSILGTWRGEPGDEWRSSQGFQSVFISILSLLNQDPYKNEPGFEDYDKPANIQPATPQSPTPAASPAPTPQPPTQPRYLGNEKEAKAYIRKIRHETLRISVIQRLEEYLNLNEKDTDVATPSTVDDDDDDDRTRRASPVPPSIGMWVDKCKRLFLWYYDIYLAIILREQSEVKDGTAFDRMPFESVRNGMEGEFNYHGLETRLRTIRRVLDEENETWIENGRKATKNYETIASNLNHQFQQCQAHFDKNPNGITITLEMEKDNPFLWTMVYFGTPMSKWDGGLFTIKIIFSTTFPQEYPRVRIVTPFFHANVTSDGIPYYRVTRADSAQAHIEAILDIFEKDMNPDPSCVLNKKCAEMYWQQGEAGKREYNKTVRRVVTRSIEYENA